MTPLTTLRSLHPSTQKNLANLFLVAFFFWTSITCLLPTLPPYVKAIGGTDQDIGLVMGSFAIGLLLSRTGLGRVADHHSRKLVVLIGTAVAATAPLGYLLVPSIAGLMVVRAYHGISIAAFTTGYSSLTVDLSPVKQKGEIIGYMTLAMPIGMAIGPALGGFLQEFKGYTFLFLMAGISGLLSFLLTFKIENINPLEIHNEETKISGNWRELLTSRGIGILTLILGLIGLVFGNLVAFVSLYIEQIGGLNPGLFYTVIAIASFSARVLVGRISDVYGRGIFISGSLFCYIISMFFLSIANSPVLLLLAGIFEGMGAGVLIPMIIALMSDRCYPSERGRVFALCLGGFDLGIALAGPIFGSFTNQLGYRGLYVISSLLTVLALVSFLLLSNKSVSASWRFAFGKTKDLYGRVGK